MEKEKTKLKINNALTKFTSLRDEVSKLPIVKNLSEAKISEYVQASKEWKKDLKSYQSLKESVDIEVLSNPIDDEELKTNYSNSYKEMLDVVTVKMEELMKADSDLGLHSLADTKGKRSVEYPKKFSGNKGEDVFKFIKEFEDALDADHVRKADEVKVLTKLLDGRAKSCVGTHHKTVKEALEQLKETFGVPKLILAEYYKTYEEKFGNPRKWGKHGSQQRLDAIDGTLDFMRQLKALATDHSDSLKTAVYSDKTLETLAKGMPLEYQKRINEDCSHSDTLEMWFITIFTLLESVRDANVSAITTGFGTVKSTVDSQPSSKVNLSSTLDGHNCKKSKQCKDKWDFLGCVQLYKEKTAADRKTFLFKRKACFYCGKAPFIPNKKHICSWLHGKIAARCIFEDPNGAQCHMAAALCSEHPNNASEALKDWLLSINIKFSVNVIIINPTDEMHSTSSYYEDLKLKLGNPDPSVTKVKSKQMSRKSLQEGSSSLMMNNEELHEFFTADMRKINPDATVHKIPDGEPVFIFSVIQGLHNSIMAFIDSGANCWLAKEGIPEREFVSSKLADGPIPLYVASGITTYASAEYGSLIPLSNGDFQTVRGLTLKKVTADMPELDLRPAFEQIKANCVDNKTISNLKIPKVVGGDIQMIIGIKYASIFPKVVHTFPSGLTVFESRLKPDEPGALACLGGPLSALEHLCENIGQLSTMTYMANLIKSTDNYLKIDSLSLFKCEFEDETYSDVFSCDVSCVCCGALQIQSELEKFMKMQDSGLDTTYKCPKCRECKSCLKGSGQELLNMKEEYQQQIIEDSVRIDDELGQAVARLAFDSDPNESLANNEVIARKRLKNVCAKYANNQPVREMISRGFKKLVDRGHIKMYEDLSEYQQKMLEQEPSYCIPWDVSFKEDSFTTPARPVFDASSKTAKGGSLNDNLAKGRTALISLFAMVLCWLIGPVAVHGDISQFYNCVLLDEKDWKFQQVVWVDDLDMENPIHRGVVKTLIYGVVCVAAQTQYVKRLLGDRRRESAILDIERKVADFISNGFYVDDGGTSVRNQEEADDLTMTTDQALNSIKMKVKGWSISFRPPSCDVTDDSTVGFAGMTWVPEIDSYSLKIQRLHFGKKKRGRFPDSLEMFKGGCMEDFVPEILTRKMCASVTARIYDVPGILAPLILKLKYDLRKIIEVNPGWDTPINSNLRSLWIENFRFIEEMRDVMYVRCQIPADALRCTVRFWLLCDASPDGGILIQAYSGHERKDGSWSCQLLCAKSLLCPKGWTTPQAELHALSSLANLAHILRSVLDDWIEIMRWGSDSTIAICWTVYEKVRLHVFHRLRVANIRSKTDMNELYHVAGKLNISDTGTRPDLLKPEHLLPGSEWLCGKEWMRMSVDDAVSLGAIKSVKDIKLDNQAKRVFKEGVILDSSINSAFKLSREDKLSLSKRVIERETFSRYLLSPRKWSFPKFVRIMAFVKLVVRNWKYKLALRRQERGLGLSDGSSPKTIMSKEPVKFTVFSVFEGSHATTCSTLTEVFNIHGVNVALDHKSIWIQLTDDILSQSLEYIYKKTTEELIHFNDKKLIQKIGVLSEGIIYCKSRIEESQQLKVVGGLEDSIDLKSFTGINFRVPVIDRYSPVAIMLASHLHYNVIKHQGAETVYRMSLQYVHILGGRNLLKMIRDECAFCQKTLQKYTKQLMGPLADQQLSITPIFYYTFADAWGPLRAFVPGYERASRAGSKVYEVYILVLGCAATGMVNCQVLEAGKKTSNVLDALNRFFHESCVPKVFYIDKDGAFIKSLSEAEMELVSNDGSISKERGIRFETCSAQGHNAHGRIERKIKMLQEAFDRSELKKFKLNGLGWQTLAKSIEHQVNSIPLGYLNHREDGAPLLRILSPNFLKLNAGANRSPSSLFSLPNSGKDLFSRVADAYRVFYKVWNDDYVPLIAKRQKWHDEHQNLEKGDIVYFKLTDSVLGSKWLIGKIEDVKLSKDGKVRVVIVGYKYESEPGKRDFRLVERPVRECVKLFNIEDTTIFEDIRSVRDFCKVLLGGEPLSTTSPRLSETNDKHSVIKTSACNAMPSKEGYPSFNAVDLGFSLENHCDIDSNLSCSTCDIMEAERELGVSEVEETYEFFDINVIDDYFSDEVILM